VSVGFIQERLREETSPLRRAELQRLVEQRSAAIHDLSSQVSVLSDRVDEVRRRAGEGSAEVEDMVETLEELRRVVGLRSVEGPGVVVELSDSPRGATTRDELTDLRIQDVDLQLVANTLWRAGAEAVSVNGRRLTSTSAIRKAGTAILVNYRAVSSPYRVVAIGDPDALLEGLERSDIAERFAVWKEIYGLGFSLRSEELLEAPALSGLQDFRHAVPVETGR
jgi:uncharacterized protein YlxW (UPF0749 family)